MKEKITNGLQRFSKAMFVPILILPIVGILIAFSNVLSNTRLAEFLPFLDITTPLWFLRASQPSHFANFLFTFQR